ncbi:MAG: AmmeMemoRadiSam system protein B [Legionellales bacterium]|nr:AmmeMemoRadiSam system protein B [Legionellales bacterium]|tara:strand:+ start:154 stop:999 length:846 start_codon:yes stop_codon:yes gene_type:complete
MSLPPIKEPNVAGSFYPGKPDALRKYVADLIVKGKVPPSNKPVKAIIAPHAGYQYSGPVAGTAYRFVQHHPVQTVVLLAPSHKVAFEGISVWSRGLFETPLGRIPINRELAIQLVDNKNHCVENPKLFENEHSLEVQLPFIQCLYPTAEIIPVLFGQPKYAILETFAQHLHHLITHRPDVLIVVSSDFSHYHSSEVCEKLDQNTLKTLMSCDPHLFWDASKTKHIECCGQSPITALLLFAQLAGLNNIQLLESTHSGKSTADNARVVGYSALALMDRTHEC